MVRTVKTILVWLWLHVYKCVLYVIYYIPCFLVWCHFKRWLLYGMPTWKFVLSAWSKSLTFSTIGISLDCIVFSFLFIYFSTSRVWERENNWIIKILVITWIELFSNLTFVTVILFWRGMEEGGCLVSFRTMLKYWDIFGHSLYGMFSKDSNYGYERLKRCSRSEICIAIYVPWH